MAARKKAKSKASRKKAPARKPATRKMTAPVRKKAAAKKTTARRVAPKKKAAPPRVAPTRKPASRPVPAHKTRAVSPAPRPAAAVVPAAPAPLEGEERIGIVTHYFSQISVAIVRLDSGSLRVGDTIHVTGHTSDFGQRVESLQLEHQPVSEVSVGQEFGLKVAEHARENDVVYKVAAP